MKIRISTIILIILTWGVTMGGYAEIYYGNMPAILLCTLIDYLFIAFFMMIIPFLYKRKNKFANFAKAKKLCRRNILYSVLMLLVVDVIFFGGFYDIVFQNLGENLVYAFMFYFINKNLFFSK